MDAIEEVFCTSLTETHNVKKEDSSFGKVSVELTSQENEEITFFFDEEKISGVKINVDSLASMRSVPVSSESAKVVCETQIENIKRILDLDKEYTITSWDEIDDAIVIYHTVRQLDNGIDNVGQSINIVYDKIANQIVQIWGFDYDVNAQTASISQQEAMDIVTDYMDSEVEIDTCVLMYVDPTLYQNEDIETTTYSLAYQIRLKSGMVLVIDAVSGNRIGIDMVMGDEARSYAITESNVEGTWGYRGPLGASDLAYYNSTRLMNIQLASAAFRRLGYNVTLSQQFSSSAINASVQYYLQGNNSEYGFYFSGHGNSSLTSMGTKYAEVFNIDDISGNWHFVYLDGCYTGSADDWADAFHIDGYNNRAYLGWRGDVLMANTYRFNEIFFPMLNGSIAVRQAAVDAAAQVPGDGTTPIRFYGDTTYDGTSWS